MEAVATPPANASAPAPVPTPAPTPTPAPNASGSAVQGAWFREFIREDGSLNHAALDRAPEHVKPITETWKRAKNFEDIAVQHTNSNFLNGKKALAPLSADAPPEAKTERKALMDSLNGVPAAAKDYGIARPQDLPEQFWSQPAADNLSAWAHKHSVSPAAAKELMSTHAELIKGQAAEHEQYVAKYHGEQQQLFEATIRQENIPAERASALIDKGVISLGLDPASPETQKLLKDSAAVRLMAMRHAVSIGESPTVTANSQGTMTPDPAAAAADISSNPANPLHAAFWNKDQKFSQTQHRAAVEKRNQLLQQAEAAKKK